MKQSHSHMLPLSLSLSLFPSSEGDHYLFQLPTATPLLILGHSMRMQKMVWSSAAQIFVNRQPRCVFTTMMACRGGNPEPSSTEVSVVRPSLSVCPSAGLSVYLSVCLSLRWSVCLSVCVSVPPLVCLFICPSVCPSACLSVCVQACVCQHAERAEHALRAFKSSLVMR